MAAPQERSVAVGRCGRVSDERVRLDLLPGNRRHFCRSLSSPLDLDSDESLACSMYGRSLGSRKSIGGHFSPATFGHVRNISCVLGFAQNGMGTTTTTMMTTADPLLQPPIDQFIFPHHRRCPIVAGAVQKSSEKAAPECRDCRPTAMQHCSRTFCATLQRDEHIPAAAAALNLMPLALICRESPAISLDPFN